MPRKKKKPARSDDGVGSPSPEAPNRSQKSKHDDASSGILRIRRVVRAPSAGKGPPKIIMAEADASRLSSEYNFERAFVIGSRSAALLPVVRSAPAKTPRKGTGTVSIGSSSMSIPPGTIQITSSSLVDLLFGKDSGCDSALIAVENDDTAAFIVPESQLPLGQQLSKLLCRPCSCLTVSSSDFDPSMSCDTAIILKRLIVAQCIGAYLLPGQSLNLSFGGKMITVSVDVATTVEEDDSKIIQEALEHLVIEDDSKVNNDNQLVLERVKRYNKKLFESTHSTNIQIAFPSNQDGENEPQQSPPSAERFFVGLDQTLKEVVTQLSIPLFRSTWFSQRGLQVPKGLLIHGACGKTSLAKQAAQDLQCSFEYVHCATLQVMASVVGQAERTLQRLFNPRDESKPFLVILDDVHLICPKRGSKASSDHLSATLLSLIDGVKRTPVVLLATTTDPNALDPALRRPGRLDTEVEVPIPDDSQSRAAILRFHAERLGFINERDPSHLDWMLLAKLAKGFHGGDCMLAMKEAGRLAFLHGTTSPSIDQLKAAIGAVKPSAIKSITVEIPEVRWDDIGGMEEVKRSLKQVVQPPASLFSTISAPRGVLLYGPPGCSKTLMARALASESHMNFLAVKGPELLSKWLGESERALASLFRRARMASPSIIFFDEIDAIAVKRGGNDSAGSGRLLSQLLTELDGIGTADGRRVIVVAATNRPDLLDHALVRPGRIDRKIYVGVPDFESRRKILLLTLKKKVCSNDVNVESLAQRTEGCSGAELVALCRDAALFALEADGAVPRLNMSHLEKANSELNRQITEDMLSFYSEYRQTGITA